MFFQIFLLLANLYALKFFANVNNNENIPIFHTGCTYIFLKVLKDHTAL